MTDNTLANTKNTNSNIDPANNKIAGSDNGGDDTDDNSIYDKEKLFSQTSQQLSVILNQWRRKYLFQKTVLFLPILFAVSSVVFYLLWSFVLSPLVAMSATVLVIVSIFAAQVIAIKRSQQYKELTPQHLLLHLNRYFPELEESAQLLACDQQNLSLLERLQFNKVLVQVNKITSRQLNSSQQFLSPKFAQKIFNRVMLASSCLVLLVLLSAKYQWLEKALSVVQANNHSNDVTITTDQPMALVDILSQQVIVEPPAYSITILRDKPVDKSIDKPQEKLIEQSRESSSLNVNTLAGSKITWLFNFTEPKRDYFLNFSNGERHQLKQKEDGSYYFQHTFTASTAYHLSLADNDSTLSDVFSAVYSIKIIADKAPKIRIITPKKTVTEFTENAVPQLISQVQIYDDFAITEVEILASIAKGSGEGVKFRDQRFTFDYKEEIAGKYHYYKNWQLSELNMEPGDELYFTVLAKDNRAPITQQTRSSTKIVRWLEAGQQAISADGILIDFMPEYFKSQRQIIIETIELIEDKPDLTADKYRETSELLGVAQSELKEKYGQYLGDEFEGQHSVGVSFADDNEHHDEHQKPTVHVHDDHGGSNAVIIQQAPEHDHSHAGAGGIVDDGNNNDISGKMALINQYGHNHEDSDVGVMTSQDPKALMKKSLENMWQAELHLMLSEPEQALPYEKKALKLLKQAKKAERIYVKRLGFEPPPVSEKRRYQGEQKDIISGHTQQTQFQPAQLSDQKQLTFKRFLKMSQAYQLSLAKTKGHANTSRPVLNAEMLTIVQSVKQALTEMAVERPALVSSLATVERILLKQSLTLNQCDNCLESLMAKLVQLLPAATAVPSQQRQKVLDAEPLLKNYGQFLKDNS